MHHTSRTSRRAFLLGVAATGTAAIPLGTADPATAATPKVERDGATKAAVEPADTTLGVNVKLFAPKDPKSDWTDAFQAAIDLAGAAYKRVIVPNGTYRVRSLRVPKRVRIVGIAADGTAHDPSPIDNGGVNLVRIDDGTTMPMVRIAGHGVTLEHLVFNGSGVAADVLVFENGFDSRMTSVRVTNSARSGIVGTKLNNTHWMDVFVSRCGSMDAAAVILTSPLNSDTSRTMTNSNTVTLLNCTIEASRNVALDIGWGTGKDAFVEFVRFIALHVETAGPTVSSDATIRIGNVRSVEFEAPFIYGAPGRALIRYERRRAPWTNLSDGLRIVGGTLLGANRSGLVDGVDTPLEATPTLLHLVTGDDVVLSATRLGQFTESAVSIDERFGPRVVVDATNSALGTDTDRNQRRSVPIVVDNRGTGITARPGSANADGMVRLDGDLRAGTISFDVSYPARAGSQVDVKFGTTYTGAPIVSLTPLTPAAARARCFVAVSTRGFIVHFADVPPPAASTGEQYRFAYRIERRRHPQGLTFVGPIVLDGEGL